MQELALCKCVLSCPVPDTATADDKYLYNTKSTLISKSEQGFYDSIKASVPDLYHVFPQINLASFIDRTDNARFHNELFRNVDFLVTDAEYTPKIVIEINDLSHLTSERKERDEKVQNICEEAGIPILKLWTSYGINREYIKKRIDETLNALPAPRVHHFDQSTEQHSDHFDHFNSSTSKKKTVEGCYIASCVYGSYDCPEVWVLRRYRDNVLKSNCFGRAFVKIYYALSPTLVRHLGKYHWFVNTCKSILDSFVAKLKINGFESTPYKDKN